MIDPRGGVVSSAFYVTHFRGDNKCDGVLIRARLEGWLFILNILRGDSFRALLNLLINRVNKDPYSSGREVFFYRHF